MFLKLTKTKNPGIIRDSIKRKFRKDIEVFILEDTNILDLGALGEKTMPKSAALKLKKVARNYNLKADGLWGSPSISKGYKSAWLYAYSGFLYQLVGEFYKAGKLYHYAGHQFRSYDFQRKSMEFYFKSAGVIKKNNLIEDIANNLADRSMRRALGVAISIKDEQDLSELMKNAKIYHEMLPIV